MFRKHGLVWVLVAIGTGCVGTTPPSEKGEQLARSDERGDGLEAGKEAAASADQASATDVSGTNIPIQRCSGADGPPREDAVPPLCSWLNSIDVVAVGEVASLAPASKFHSVDYTSIRVSAPALRELGLEDRVPWLESLLRNELDGQFHVVDSCPDGMVGQNETWSLMVSEFPTLSIRMKNASVIKGSLGGEELEFFVGNEQLRVLSGPVLTKESVEQDAEFAPGTYMGVPLTRSGAEGVFVLGFEVPFRIDEKGQLLVQESCEPKMPTELNGLTVASLRAKVAECAKDEASLSSGQGLREQRLRRISAPKLQPHFAAQCAFLVEDKRVEVE